eukprot:3584889-Prymnesium_polylepis.1
MCIRDSATAPFRARAARAAEGRRLLGDGQDDRAVQGPREESRQDGGAAGLDAHQARPPR